MIEIKNLTKTFTLSSGKVEALKDVSLTVNDGEIYGIIGMSGAGKSTLVRCINMLERPTSGNVIFDGVDMGSLGKKELRETRRKITMIFQGFNLIANLTALENVEIGLEAAGIPSAARRARALDMLTLTGLSGRENQIPAELSGGQKQRVSLARVLALSPPVLLMDEPFAALDAITREQMQLLLVTLHARIGMGIILVTHDVEEALLLGDEVCVMAPGQGIVASRRVEVPRTGDVTDRKLLRELKTILRQSMAGQGGPLLLS